MRLKGRVIKTKKGKVKVIEPANYIFSKNLWWVEVIEGNYDGYEVGDQTTMSELTIKLHIERNRG